MIGNRTSDSPARLRSLLPRSATIAVLVFAFAVAANAYTLVFRNGQRIEIPDEFTVTRTTVTFEISPGFQKTILLSLVDIAATERANGEPWGSFFKRAQRSTVQRSSPPADQDPQPSTPATRTITNSDLAAFRQRRIESEQAYEKRRLQLGLPTVAETRRRQDMEAAALREEFRAKSSSEKREEAFWRGRARELRTEIAMVDNQINYVRSRLTELNESSRTTESWTSTYPIWPDFGRDRWGRRNRRDRRQNPTILGPQYPNQYPYGYPPGQYPNGYPGQYPYGYPGQYPYGYPGQYPYGYPTDPYGNPYPYGYPTRPYEDAERSAQQTDLTRRLDDLLVQRAGLMVQWRALEDEARDARVPQVWLEP